MSVCYSISGHTVYNNRRRSFFGPLWRRSYIIYSIIILTPSLRLRPVLTTKPTVASLYYYYYIIIWYNIHFISVIIVYRRMSVRARFIRYFDVGETVWQMVFFGSLFYSSPHTGTLVNPRWPKTHTRGSSVKVNAGGGGDGHTRRLIPMAKRNNFTILFSYVSLSCCGSRDYSILYILHYSHNIINKYIIRVPTII